MNRQQLMTAVSVGYAHHHYLESPEMVVRGIVFYMRRTRILKRLVRKIIHKIEIPVGDDTIENTKAEARQHLENFVKEHYHNI